MRTPTSVNIFNVLTYLIAISLITFFVIGADITLWGMIPIWITWHVGLIAGLTGIFGLLLLAVYVFVNKQ